MTDGDGTAELLPLFPLGTVLVPGLVLPLHVFEPRYRLLVRTLLERPEAEREFGVVAIREGHEVGSDAVKALFGVGTTALVRAVTPHEDGTYALSTVGHRRFVLDATDDALPYLRGRVHYLDEPAGDASAALAPGTLRRFADYRAAVAGTGAIEAEDMPDVPDDPAVLSYLVTAAMVLDLADRQRLLEADSTADRLRALDVLLRRETGLLRTLPSLPAVHLAGVGFAPN